MYVRPNYATKKAIREALKRGERIEVFSPGPFPAPLNGRVALEGPHYPEPHRWYGEGIVKDGFLTAIK